MWPPLAHNLIGIFYPEILQGRLMNVKIIKNDFEFTYDVTWFLKMFLYESAYRTQPPVLDTPHGLLQMVNLWCILHST